VPNRLPLLALACAITSSNVYLAQPLLGLVGDDLAPGSVGAAGSVGASAQLGYAAGILLLVPLADGPGRRRLVLVLCGGVTVALVAAGLAPGLGWLAAASLLVGLFTPIPQIVIPMGVALAGAGAGRVVGVLQAGLLVGLLASRSWAGALGQLLGWRAVYLCAAAMMVALTAALLRWLPDPPLGRAAGHPATYPALLASLPGLTRSVWLLCLSGCLVGVAFGAFWSTVTFQLAAGYRAGPASAGLLGLVAAASALTSPLAGRLADRAGAAPAQAAALGVGVLGWLALALGGHRLEWLLIGTVLLDVGVWSNQVVNQVMLFGHRVELHARLNTVYFSTRFVGIAAGSALGGWVWAQWGWPAVSVVGTAVLLAAAPLAVRSTQRARQC
jgi:predicted MFS family arabinose efflux permease